MIPVEKLSTKSATIPGTLVAHTEVNRKSLFDSSHPAIPSIPAYFVDGFQVQCTAGHQDHDTVGHPAIQGIQQWHLLRKPQRARKLFQTCQTVFRCSYCSCKKKMQTNWMCALWTWNIKLGMQCMSVCMSACHVYGYVNERLKRNNVLSYAPCSCL